MITLNSEGVIVWLISGIGTVSTVINRYKSVNTIVPQALKISYYSGIIYTCYISSNRVYF